MRAPAAGHQSETAFNMTPLIDIVFMLLLFFMLTLHLEDEQSASVALAKADEAELVEKLPPKSLVVTVTPDGFALVGGRQMLTEELESELIATNPDDLPERIIVRADASARYEAVQEVLSSAGRAGITKVELLVSREAEALD